MSYQVHNFQTGDVIEAAPINEMDQQIQLNEQNIGGKADKVVSATSGNFAALDSNGNLTDSGHKHSDYLTSHQDISGKADKVTGATNGDLAGLDSNGNLTDSGISPTIVSGKADKVSGATTGNFAGLDNEGNITDSGKSATDFIASTLKGVANGVAELDANGIIPTAQLPGYVDDVLEYSSVSAFPATGESGKIYVALDTNKTYRWSGTEYVEISASLALGETSSTAYRGDRGRVAYDHATDSGRLTTATIAGLYKVSVTTEGHVGSATAVQKSDITALGIPAQDTTYEPATESVDGLMSASDKTKLNNAVTGITMNGSSQTKDGNGVVDLGTVLTQHQDISGKADKVSGATNGNFAALDANGNITDSGHKHSDYLTSHQDISGKADKVMNATSGNFAGLDNNGNITDSGKSSSDFIAVTSKGSANGVAELDANGLVPTSQLPSYVDDVLEYASTSAFPVTGETGKIYVALDTNKTYRWSGSEYVEISASLAIGETSSTAYRGDRGAAAYAAAVTNVESTPSSGSTNLITSGGVYSGLSGKADKVTNATNGNFASLDSNGNLTDSGSKASDFLTSHQDISGKADKDTDAVVGNFASFDASGNPVDSGHKHSDYITDVSDKADKVASATSGHFAGLDSNGNLADSGVSSSDFIASSLKGSVNGVAELNANGIVPSSQLPSYVDDVVDGYFYDNKFYEDDQHTIEIPGESGKIYVDLSTNKTYRWSGTTFVVIASDLALGETSSTAYRGDRGAAAYAAAVTNVDSTPTSGSGNLVTSGGVYSGLSGKTDKVASATSGNFAGLDSNGNLTDSGHKHSDYLTSHQDITGKADKVTSATNGNFAALDSNGNLTDSGSKASDFLTSHQDISGKADKDTNAVEGNFASFDSNGNPVDSGHKHSDYITSHQDITGKADKVTSATNGHFAGLDSNGNLTDSGKSATDFIASTAKGAVNGVAELDTNGKVPTAQLPSYVDDVLEYADLSSFPATGETGKIYVALDTNKTYRWSGSEYVEISASLALGETSSTAYRGDRGKTAYDHATDASRLTTAQTSGLYKIATTAEGHVASVTAVQKADITALGIPAQDTTYESKAAASGGTDVSLVTTGEKYGWNSKSTVYEYASVSSFPATGVAGQLYIALDTNVIYRWDTTTSDYVAISGGGGGGGSAGLEKKAISIATTDWTSATGGYTATVTDSRITSESEVLMIYDSSVSSLTSNIEMTKNTGSVTFSVATMPTGTISGVLYIINELHVNNGLPAVTAADNGKILQVVNGAWGLVSIPSATGVSF